MTDFNFENLTAEVAKTEDIPVIKRPRNIVNPMMNMIAKSSEKEDEGGYGQWLSITVPGKASSDGKNYGATVTAATGYLSRAANAAGKGLAKGIKDNGDGSVTITFRTKPKGKRVVKKSAEKATPTVDTEEKVTKDVKDTDPVKPVRAVKTVKPSK